MPFYPYETKSPPDLGPGVKCFMITCAGCNGHFTGYVERSDPYTKKIARAGWKRVLRSRKVWFFCEKCKRRWRSILKTKTGTQ